MAEGRSCPEDDSFLYLDPRGSIGGGGGGRGEKYSEVIVFVLGGGCYSEFFNLQELLRDKAAGGGALRSITYGCSELLSGDGFIDQLQRMTQPKSVSSEVKK